MTGRTAAVLAATAVVLAGLAPTAAAASPTWQGTPAARAAWPPPAGQAPAFQRVPAKAGVLYAKPKGRTCPLGFAHRAVWDRGSTLYPELSGQYADVQGQFLKGYAGRRVTMISFDGRLIARKAALRKGQRICQRIDGQLGKPYADPAGTIMGLPVGFPAKPTVDDVQALGLGPATRTVPTFQVPQPARPRSVAKLPTSIRIASVTDLAFLGETPNTETPNLNAPYGWSPRRTYHAQVTWHIAGGSGVLRLRPILTGWLAEDLSADVFMARLREWSRVVGFVAPPGPGPHVCCDAPSDFIPLSPGGAVLLDPRPTYVGGGWPLRADGTTSRPAATMPIPADLGGASLGVFDDYGQAYLPESASHSWELPEFLGPFDARTMLSGSHPATVHATSQCITPDNWIINDALAAERGLDWASACGFGSFLEDGTVQ